MVSGSLAGSPDTLRLELLAAAGFSQEKQVDLIRKTIAKTEEALDATKSVVLAVGNDVIEVEVPDGVARQKARDQVFDLVGIRAPRTNATQVVKHVVEIEWPDFMCDSGTTPLDITPSQPTLDTAALLPTNETPNEAQ